MPRAKVTVTVDVSEKAPRPGAVAYSFAVMLTESAGIGATVTSVGVQFDNGFGGARCSLSGDRLSDAHLAANGTLALNPLTCGYEDGSPAFNANVAVELRDDNDHVIIEGTLVEKL